MRKIGSQRSGGEPTSSPTWRSRDCDLPLAATDDQDIALLCQVGSQVAEWAAAPCLPRPSGRERRVPGGARARPRGAWPGRGAPGAAQRPLMFANPGLSGGRGPSCWPNNRRLKGERRARGAPAPTTAPPTASPPGTDLGAMRGDSARSGAHMRPGRPRDRD